MENRNRPSLWKGKSAFDTRYARDWAVGFPWRREHPEDLPRYRKLDGWWFDPAAPESGKALLSCTGDCMCEPFMHQANRYGDTYFFQPCFQFVRPIFRSSDFVVGNLETTVSELTPYAGEYHKIAGKYHCNAPDSYLDALRYAGFDTLVTANNHNIDSGAQGLIDTMRALDAHGFAHTGTFCPGETERAVLVRVNGIRIAVLSYATYYNKMHDYFTQEGQDTLLNAYCPEKAQKDVAWARERGAEFVLCYIHWGKEHKFYPNEDQKRIAQELADAGVDYILGSHSHCLQTHETVTAKDGRHVPVQFSLGNFITSATLELNQSTGILQLGLSRENGTIRVREYFIPCRVMDELGTGRYTVVPTSPALNGGIDHPNFRRTEEFARQLADLPWRQTAELNMTKLFLLTEAPARNVDGGLLSNGYTTEVDAVHKGCIFFDLVGDRAAVLEAKQRGAGLLVTPLNILDFPVARAKAPEEAYIAAVREMRTRFPAKTVLISGLGGKTLTKSVTAAILREKFHVFSPKDGPLAPEDAWTGMHPFDEWSVEEFRSADAKKAALTAKAICPEAWVVLDDLGLEDEKLEAYLRAADAKHLLLNGDCTSLVRAARTLPDGKAEFFRSFDHDLPLPDLGVCFGAALAVGALAGIDGTKTAEVFSDFGYTMLNTELDGIHLIVNATCKSAASAKAACEALASAEGEKIAVFAPLDSGADYSALIASCKAEHVLLYGTRMNALPGAENVGTPDELEKRLLALLRDGQTLLLCGGRCADFSRTVRRIFGLCDGFIAEEWKA